MSNLSPIKPPRGIKYGKEVNVGGVGGGSCGLLVTVIKSLDSSETNEERQKEKLKIEKEFKKCDTKLNDLVAMHDGDLAKIMQLFGQVSTKITNSRNQIHLVKNNLYECKKLLRCRRDELQKLWMDVIQQKYVSEMLEQINNLSKVPGQVQTFMVKKQYLHATKTLIQGLELAKGPLSPIEGLNDLRNDLDQRVQQLYTKLIKELSKHLYQLSTIDILSNFHRHGSTRTSNYSASTPANTVGGGGGGGGGGVGGGTPLTSSSLSAANHHHHHQSPFIRNGMRRSAERAEANQKMRKILFELSQSGFDLNKTELIEDTDLLDSDASFFIIIECFALLKKIPNSIETIKSEINGELLELVSKTTDHVRAIRSTLIPSELLQCQHPLLELLELVYSEFKLIAGAHNLLLKHYLNAMQRHEINDCKPYDIYEFWTQAQSVFQLLLSEYLDIQNTSIGTETPTSSSFTDQSSNVNTFFNRRKIQIKKTLFKFDKSSIASLEMNQQLQQHHESDTTNKEHRRNFSDISNEFPLNNGGGTESGGKRIIIQNHQQQQQQPRITLVCPANSALLRKIYIPLISYIQEIETFMKLKSGQRCSLHGFIITHVKDTFLANGHNRTLEQTIESLSKNQDAWRTIITPEQMKLMGLNRPLLQSTVLFENRIVEIKQLIEDLPDYSEDLLKMVCKLLKTYRETCQAAYRGIVQPETEDKRIYSVAWLKDEDITRFLKTLPNWTDLKTVNQPKFGLPSSARKPLKTMTSEEESPTQIQQRNIREAEMLTSNLGEGAISHQEILSDISVLKELAILQESMEWFSCRISEFANDLRRPLNSIDSITIKDGTIKVLTNLALEFDDLANTCLLVLHLEVRVQCFHYLKMNNTSNKTKHNMSQNYNKNNNNDTIGTVTTADLLEPDGKVLKFTKVLSEMEEALITTLHPRKTKYIFEGLAHLAARILINASNYMESLDQVGVQKMCRNALILKQTLGSITSSREVALDHAMNFYEMLFKDPQEILTLIIERGAQYTELQYLNALQLSCRAKFITDMNQLSSYQQQLSDILGTTKLLPGSSSTSALSSPVSPTGGKQISGVQPLVD